MLQLDRRLMITQQVCYTALPELEVRSCCFFTKTAKGARGIS